MVAITKPGGLVVVFDMDINGVFSFPATPCYARLCGMIREAGRSRGRDYEIGMKVPVMFRNAGLSQPEFALIHPIYLRGEEKRLWEYTLLETRPVMLQYGISSSEEFEACQSPRRSGEHRHVRRGTNAACRVLGAEVAR